MTLAAVLVAVADGTVSAAGRYHSAFAHKKAEESFENSSIAVPITTAQQQECSTAGRTSPIST